MSFLGPISLGLWAWCAVGAAALAVGAYIIKMRRRRFEVPFSQLWKRVLEQKDANSLWKQLKRIISLLVILLILALLLFAALDPTLGAVDRKARSVVILIDSSTVITGSYNYSENAEANNNEAFLIIEHATALNSAYSREFDRLEYAAKHNHPPVSKRPDPEKKAADQP